MLSALALVFLVGLMIAAICQRFHLPRIIGLLLTGVVLGPYVLDLLDVSLLSISSELRQIALIIILLKAGLALDLADLKKVGRPAIMMACVPACFEMLAFFLFAPYLLNITGCQYGAGRKRTSHGFRKYSDFHCTRHCAGSDNRIHFELVF